MKKWMSVTATGALAICLAAFSFVSAASAGDPETGEKENSNRSLVVYFDWAQDDSEDAAPSPEDQMARMLAERTGSDLFEVVPVRAYPEDEAELSAVTAAERASYARPPFARDVRDWKSYDRIYLGYPVRDEEMPMIMLSFLEAHNFEGKIVFPFDCYYGRTVQGAEITIASTTGVTTMEAFNLEAEVMTGDPAQAEVRMEKWMDKIGLAA